MSNRWVNRIWVARCTLIGFIYREVSWRLPEEVPKDETTKRLLNMRIHFSFQAGFFVGAWAILFWFSSILWNDVPFGKIRWQWKIQDLCNFCEGRLHVTLFDYRTVDDISGLIHPEWKATCTNCQGNILGHWSHYLRSFFYFWKHFGYLVLKWFCTANTRVVFVATFFGHLCSKN